MEIKQCGAYILTHDNSGIFYVGSSSDLNKRKNDHLSHLKKGDHHNAILQKYTEM